MSRRDRACLVLALEGARVARWPDGPWMAPDFLAESDGPPLDVHRAWWAAAWDLARYDAGGPRWPRSTERLLRARLALLLRALLRADAGDFGPTAWAGCRCSCDGDNGGWQATRYTPLWELAPQHIEAQS